MTIGALGSARSGSTTDDVVALQAADAVRLEDAIAQTASTLLSPAPSTTATMRPVALDAPTTTTTAEPAASEPDPAPGSAAGSVRAPSTTSTTEPPPPPPTTTTTAPPPPPPPTTTTTAPPPAEESYAYDDPRSTQVWYDLADCEAWGDWSLDSGNGYYGGLQFSLAAWEAVGGTGYPHEHSAAQQIEMGRRTHARQGWDAWPSCAEKLGLT
jgi:hypothetical protein